MGIIEAIIDDAKRQYIEIGKKRALKLVLKKALKLALNEVEKKRKKNTGERSSKISEMKVFQMRK